MFFITDTSFTWPPCELKTDVIWAYALEATIEETRLVSDVVEKTSTRRRSRIPCVVFEKITTRRREGVGVVVEKNEGSRRTFNKNYYDLLTAITELLIVYSRSIFRYVITDWLANYMILTVNLCFAVRPIIETKTKCARAVIYSVELYEWLRIIWVCLGLYFCVLLGDRTVH